MLIMYFLSSSSLVSPKYDVACLLQQLMQSRVLYRRAGLASVNRWIGSVAGH